MKERKQPQDLLNPFDGPIDRMPCGVMDRRTFLKCAEAENRSLSNFIETAAWHYVREDQFVDDAEMAEIRGSASLVKRLKKGSRQAKRKKGKFVG